MKGKVGPEISKEEILSEAERIKRKRLGGVRNGPGGQLGQPSGHSFSKKRYASLSGSVSVCGLTVENKQVQSLALRCSQCNRVIRQIVTQINK